MLFVKLQVRWDGKANPNNNPSRANMLIKSILLKNKCYLHMGAVPEAVNGGRYLEKIEFHLSIELFVTFFLSMPTGQYLLPLLLNKKVLPSKIHGCCCFFLLSSFFFNFFLFFLTPAALRPPLTFWVSRLLSTSLWHQQLDLNRCASWVC